MGKRFQNKWKKPQNLFVLSLLMNNSMKIFLKHKLVPFVIVIFILLVIFILKFYSYPLSDDISDWGSFGDYMMIIISIISIVLIYQTYAEQRDTNKLICFENTYWNLRKELVHISDGNLNIIVNGIKAHFSKDKNINLNQFICLLAHYWSLHVRQYNTPDFSFDYFRKLCQYIVETSLIDKEKKNVYLDLLYKWFKANELFCFICYLSHYSYCNKNVSILEFQATVDLFNDVNLNLGILVPDSLIGNTQLLKYKCNEDFGYNDSEYIKETYVETLSRLKIK